MMSKAQRAIAHTLGAMDDKIELLHRMNETLETMAYTFFKSWLVDFEPVCAKGEGSELVGLDAAMAALFPDRLEESERGLIPRGWEAKPLDEVAHFLNGLALQNFPPDAAGSLPVIKIAELRRGVTESSDRASTRLDARYIVHDGDILFSWSGSLEVCIWCGGDGALNQHLFKVTSDRYPKWFYYLWLRHYLPAFQAIAASKATTMGHIQRHHLTESYALVPSPTLMEAMDRMFAPLIDQYTANLLESRTLAQIRDTLLPRLLLGEIQVQVADQAVEAALA